jgi:hypothetical protein
MDLIKLKNLIRLDPPTKASISVHLAISWGLAAALRFVWPCLILAMNNVHPRDAVPHFMGLWLIGCCAQVLSTLIVFTTYKFSIRYWIPFLYSYWACTGIAMLGVFIEHLFVDRVPRV